jgi:hypothetical protein
MLSVRKILQALYYIQKNVPESNQYRFDIMYLLKIIYFADRYHIRHFGFFATGDVYYAMERGPVASATLDILSKKMPYSANSVELPLLDSVEKISEYEVCISKQGTDEISESFKEALDFSLKIFGAYSQFDLSGISHCYPEWHKREKLIKAGSKREVMSQKDFFEEITNTQCLQKFDIKEDPFKEPDTEFLKALRDDIDEIETT